MMNNKSFNILSFILVAIILFAGRISMLKFNFLGRCSILAYNTNTRSHAQIIRLYTESPRSNNVKSYRIERIIANRGWGSRSEVSKVLLQGKVRVNGEIVRAGSKKYSDDVQIEINGAILHQVEIQFINKINIKSFIFEFI